MNIRRLIREISAKDVDVDRFVRLAIRDDQIREEIVRQMRTHPHIMVYYHCFYIVSKASIERPDLFYPHWHEVASLLKHKNSYHRDFALTIIANLTQVDQGNLFSKIFHDYFEHINDEKFMTGQCCVQNSIKILKGFKHLYGLTHLQRLPDPVQHHPCIRHKTKELCQFVTGIITALGTVIQVFIPTTLPDFTDFTITKKAFAVSQASVTVDIFRFQL